ncbi:YegP family protein [Vibrio hibernica]|uniref:YegP family protein n=1 Tax=Vibrio hibernica TaxID=2587465 RepID=UPI0039B0C127
MTTSKSNYHQLATLHNWSEDKGENDYLRLSNYAVSISLQVYSTSCECSTVDSKYERKETAAGKHMFNLKAGNHQVISTSQSYESVASRDNGIESVKTNAPTAKIDDLT